MALIRIRYVRPIEPVIVFDETGLPIALNPAKAYRTDDPLVRRYPNAFEADEDRNVESATNNPGEKRNYRA